MKMELWGLSPLAQLLLGALAFSAIGAVCARWEWLKPARQPRLSWARVYLGVDAAIFLATLGIAGVFQSIEERLSAGWSIPCGPQLSGWHALLWDAFLVWVVLDFSMYWLHRFFHQSPLWPVHRWHHSLERVNWLSGVRSSLIEDLLDTLPAFVIYLISPGTLAWSVGYFFYTQIVIHLNVEYRAGPFLLWLERWLVLPGYHRVHHGAESRLHGCNFGFAWTVWDRLFKTYRDPRTEHDEYPLGLDRPEPFWKMAIGL